MYYQVRSVPATAKKSNEDGKTLSLRAVRGNGLTWHAHFPLSSLQPNERVRDSFHEYYKKKMSLL